MTLYTDRLTLRPLAPEDFDAAQSWSGNPANVRYMFWGPNTEEQTREFINRTQAGKDFAVVLTETGAVIGSCGIYPDSAGDTAELGWILHMDYWKRGYGTELAGELIRYGFEDLKLRRVFAPCAAVNYGSRRVMERNGMRREATHVKAFWARVDREWVDEAIYALLAEEYFKPGARVALLPYDDKYRDDVIFCFLSAKDAMSKMPGGKPLALKSDLLDIPGVYPARGDVFYLAIDEDDRVVGMIGTETVSPSELWLKRLYIKPELKSRGIGSKLLAAVEQFAADKGVTVIHTRFADWYTEAARFYPAKGFVAVEARDWLRHMVKYL
jgi:RimJ/RimL family protein N-acetyltransferase